MVIRIFQSYRETRGGGRFACGGGLLVGWGAAQHAELRERRQDVVATEAERAERSGGGAGYAFIPSFSSSSHFYGVEEEKDGV